MADSSHFYKHILTLIFKIIIKDFLIYLQFKSMEHPVILLADSCKPEDQPLGLSAQ